MFTFGKRIGLAVLGGLLAFAVHVPGAHGQIRAVPSLGPRPNPYFFVAPGLTLQQYAFNLAALGQAYSRIPPYMLGYNPYVPPIYGGGVAPVVSPYVGPYATSPYGVGSPYTATMTSTLGLPYSAGYDMGYGSSYSNPYTPYSSYENPAGAYLRGASSVIDAQGRLLTNVRQADLMKEHVRREKIENRRRMLDEYLYERDKMPTAEDERERVAHLELRRALNDPPSTEIWSAAALNKLLDHLITLDGKPGPRILLDEKMLQNINVTPKEGSRGNVGLLKNDGNLKWPLALTGEDFKSERERVNALLPEAVQDASKGRTDPGTIKELTRAEEELTKKLAGNVRDLPPAQYIEAKRFLGNLQAGIQLLASPNAERYFTKEYVAKGSTVAELVHNMKEKGLRFAPAVDGQEADYVALHRALVAYDMGVTAQSQVAENR